jgi:quinoprotein glucose dehydrogenase
VEFRPGAAGWPAVARIQLLDGLQAEDPVCRGALQPVGPGSGDRQADCNLWRWRQDRPARRPRAGIAQEPAVRGDIRAHDVHSGKLRWGFHTIPHPGEPGCETWPKDAWKYTGAANDWAGMAVDEKRGIVYAPTGSAVSDFYGADRAGNDLYANTLLALDGNTGKLIWHFQGVHHDMWDRDFPSPPALVTVKHDGKSVDAVAQPTKQGVLYLFNRVTGEPLFPIAEHPFPASTVPGEWSSPTQPMPSMLEPYARQRLTEDMLTTRTPEAHAWAVEQFRTVRKRRSVHSLWRG